MALKDLITTPLVRASLRLSFKLPSGYPVPLSVLRQGMESGSLLFKTRSDVQIERMTIGGVRGERISPPGQSQGVILHFHGGAFMAGSPNTHRAMGAEFAARANVTVYMVDYRLAPEHPYPAALDDGLAAYQALLAQGHRPENIVLGGDSGGCAHILNLAIALRDQGLPLPAGMFMISPFLDLTLSTGSVKTYKRRDPMVTAYALHRGARGYRGSIAATDPRVSPLFADLHGLPPSLVQVGGDEILLDDALRFAERAQAAGSAVDCRVYDGMWHNFQMFGQLVSKADAAVDEITDFVRKRIARA